MELKRIALYLIKTILLLFVVSVVSFALIEASPVDPVQQYVLAAGGVTPAQRENLEAYWGVNEEPVGRFVKWGAALLHGDFGTSLLYRRPVLQIITERFLASLALMFAAWALAGIIGFALGCIMGVNRDRRIDKCLKAVCYLLSSVPTFWLGLLMLLVFSVKLHWFPLGFSTPVGMLNEDVSIALRLRHLVLPSLTLSLMSFSTIAMQTREKLIGVLSSDYVLFARARGEEERDILFRHGLRNTLLPALTLQFSSFSELFGGSVMAENVFSYPGLGSAVSAAGLNSDVPLLLGITLFSALFVRVGNSIADLLTTVTDPRTVR